jgi:hypothetical protein
MTKPTVPEQLMDFVYVRPQNVEAVPSSSSLSFVKRPYHRLAVLDVAQRKKKIRLLEMNGADTEVINRFIPEDKYPIRQYYHSRTTLPMRESEWDVDSDDEPDETWLHRMSAEVGFCWYYHLAFHEIHRVRALLTSFCCLIFV